MANNNSSKNGNNGKTAKGGKPKIASGRQSRPGLRQAKPAIGFYDLTGCQGCVLSFLFNEDELLDLADHVDIRSFRFAKGARDEKQFDVVFVEGLVANNNDLAVLKTVRDRTKILVALGGCACTGCIPAYRNFIDTSKYAPLVYEKINEIKDQPATPINEHVAVDYYIPGCPPDKKQIASFIKDLLLGKNPVDYDRPVCFECRLNENVCLLGEGKLCLGPITRGGCNSVCTNGKLECWGCRGPMPDANVPLMIKVLEKKGFTKEHIKQRMRTFSGMMLEKPTLRTVTPKKIKKKPVKKPKKAAKPKAKKKAAKPEAKKKTVKAKAKNKAKAKPKAKNKKSIKKRPSAKKIRKKSSAKKGAAKKSPKAKSSKSNKNNAKKPKSFMNMLKGKLKKK